MSEGTKRKSMPRKAKTAVPKKVKRACGLCGKTRKLTKTECCDNWICNDEDKYVMFSFAKNSCYRNHDRYTLCSQHHTEEHDGKWQDCDKCKEDTDLVMYVYYVTNQFNFEKLENAPKVTIVCGNCGFESESKDDFPLSIRKRSTSTYICKKRECLKKHSL